MGLYVESATSLSAESLALLKDIETIFADPQAWLEMENTRLYGRRPIDLIGTPDEERVKHMIESYKYGLFS